jgi:hypothetical protein
MLGRTSVNHGNAVMIKSPMSRQTRYGMNGTMAFPMSNFAKAQAM